MKVQNPLIYQVKYSDWHNQFSNETAKGTILHDIPDKDLKRISQLGFDWIWLEDIWKQEYCNINDDPFRNCLLPELKPNGAISIITNYECADELGGNHVLAEFNERLSFYGLKLMLDLIPNIDNPIMQSLPFPANRSFSIEKRDNYHWNHNYIFPAFPTTLKLDLTHPTIEFAIKNILSRICSLCNGVVVDFSLLIHPRINEKTRISETASLWSEVVKMLHEINVEFCAVSICSKKYKKAMQQIGFDYVLDSAQNHTKPERSVFPNFNLSNN